MVRERIFVRPKTFSEGREEVEDVERSGRSVTARTEGKIQEIIGIMRKIQVWAVRCSPPW